MLHVKETMHHAKETMPNVRKSMLHANKSEQDPKHLETGMSEWLANRPLFIGLDRDGTLVPIHPDPAKAMMPERVAEMVGKLARLPDVEVGIVSARSVAHLQKDFGAHCEKLFVAGNYGMEISYPGGGKFIHADAEAAKSMLITAKEEMEARIAGGTPVLVEDHGLSLCLHWHLVEEKKLPGVSDMVKRLGDRFLNLHVRNLQTSYEVWPVSEWDKSKGLDLIQAQLKSKDKEPLFIFIGDSDGDEAAFDWVNKRGGISIRVDERAKKLKTCAKYHVDRPSDVHEFLESILAIRSAQSLPV